MRLSQHTRRRFSRALGYATPRSDRATRPVAGLAGLPIFTIDRLESRRLMDGETIAVPIAPILADTTTPTNNSITLNQHFNDTTLPGTLAIFNTTYGTIEVALTDAATPNTVANFLTYVNSGTYTNAIFHRSSDLTTGLGGTPEAPGTIIQGGGYNISSGSLNHVPVNAPVDDEYTTELYGDIAGTLAMAKTSSANSATSEFYFNVVDNTELDSPTTDPNGVTTSYTVFGKVLSGSDVISAIAALPTADIGSGLETVPVTGLTEAQLAANTQVNANNLVYTTDVTTEVGTSYNVSSDNTALVIPTVTNGVLSFTYGAGLSGTAQVTVTGTNLDGTSTSTVISVTVPNSATPGAGPVAAAYTAPFTVTGTTSTFSVLGPDTDSVSALDPASVTITTQPTNGSATVNTSTGQISYTPTAGYTGPDSLTYTVADVAGTVSAPATVTLAAVPTAIKLNVSAGTTLIFDQPNGVVGHLTVTGATAVVTFTDYQVTTKKVGRNVVASGAGTDITDIEVVNKVASASLVITSTGPISIGSVNDPNALTRFYAPTATLSGNCSFGFISSLTLGALSNANVSLGALESGVFSNLVITTATNSDVNANGNLGVVKSNKWVITDGQTHTLQAAFINDLEVVGTFDEDLYLYSSRYALANCRVGTPTGSWTVVGEFAKGTLANPSTKWALTDDGEIANLTVTGTLQSQITAAAIAKLAVKGPTTNAVLQTTGTGGSFLLIGHLTFGGPVTTSVIFSNASIGSITAPSITSSRIYAGVAISVAQAGSLASSATDLTSNSSIGSIVLGTKGTTTFASSLISADIVGVLRLGKVNTSNGGTVEGISAHIAKNISATLVPGGILKAGPAQLKTAAILAAYVSKAKLTLGDFAINLF